MSSPNEMRPTGRVIPARDPIADLAFLHNTLEMSVHVNGPDRDMLRDASRSVSQALARLAVLEVHKNDDKG